ncbi:TIGR00730 family Rossman fold protein [Kiloniella laminariae]|uniref:Cytokinin riboside 5'-monophosphate phosphoribohydrolase n=1 Tax=Kiloniella laminariae TaxID=454162 RepID=A0ABT4LH77_9PROT|nr:TIGR00730 family Rossman fold protein [Kiloniella laminariae]MCZ4280462.1 TIGR00730 family Rossman fold protein [Kiloniella laminariae]
MSGITSICVYCGSSNSVSEKHLDQATLLGQRAAEKGIEIIYGGGRVGSMGRVADGALTGKGRVTGIIPEYLQRFEVGHTGVSELVVVDSMHTRKMQMFERSDAFCILPGGLGTLEEFFEVATWKQLGMHDKPIILINLENFWTPLTDLIDHQIECGYLRQKPEDIYSVVNSIEEVFQTLESLPDSRVKPDITLL